MQDIDNLSGTIVSDMSITARLSAVEAERYEDVDMRGTLAMRDVKYKAAGAEPILLESVEMAFSPQYVDLKQFALRGGKSNLQANGRLDNLLAYFKPDQTLTGKLTVRSPYFNAADFMPPSSGEAEPVATTTTVIDTTSAADERPFDRFDFTIDAEMDELVYDAYTLRDMVAKGHFTSSKMRVDDFQTKVGGSDFSLTGELRNVFGWMFDGQLLRGDATFYSRNMDANELMAMVPAESGNSTQTTTTTTTSSTPTSTEPPVDRFDLELDARIDRLVYDTYTLTGTEAKGHFTPALFKAKTMKTKIGQNDFSLSGELRDVFGYLYGDETLTGTATFYSNNLDADALMAMMPQETAPTATPTSGTSAPAEASSAFVVPDKVELTLDSRIDRLVYTGIEVRDMRGQVQVTEGRMLLNDTRARTMGGTVALKGGYDSTNPAKPMFDFGFEIEQFAFQQAFNTLNSFEAFAPVGKYIQGAFNSTMYVKGELGQDMMPKLETLTADGVLQTINGIIKGFKPLQKLGEQYSYLSFLKDEIPIKNTKNFFEIANGIVEVDTFDVAYKGIDMSVNGRHGLNMSMDYDIRMRIPQEWLAKTGVTSQASAVLGKLSGELQKFGVPVSLDKDLFLVFNMTGSSTNPSIRLKGVTTGSASGPRVQDAIKDQVNAAVDKAVDSVKTVAQQQLDKAKDKAQAAADKAVDSVKTVVQNKAQEAADKVKDQVKDKVSEEVKDRVGTAVEDKVKEEVGKDVEEKVKDKVKEGLGKYNPFGSSKPNE